ncbi:hypothetical protein QR680_001264 [Steinernema hermaphroditum]|uniref:Dienelactone hydrolase domain-containing protein n=1 Tax=Steinernema hermaphroditum TaxID=289476 RepID=A0AA39LFJ2_9BILA|nr:hypothetical protein QR680_001264 [Steinernema hermaphroditum]
MVVKSTVEYQVGENVFQGVLCSPENPEKKKLPAVLVHHAFFGCTDFEVEKAEKLAELGYVAFAADVYGKGVRGTSREENFALMKPLIDDRSGELHSRLKAAFDYVAALDVVNADKIAAIGFCFGGLCVLDMARHQLPLKAVVSFHGTLSPLPGDESLENLATLQTAVCVLHGDADSHVNPQVETFMKEMRVRNADFFFTSYGSAKHGFMMPITNTFNAPGVGYDARTEKRAWEAMKNFLAENLS